MYTELNRDLNILDTVSSMASSARESFHLNIPSGREGRMQTWRFEPFLAWRGGIEVCSPFSYNELSGQYSWKVNQCAGTKYLEQKYKTLDWGRAWRPQGQKHPALWTPLLQQTHRLRPGCSQTASESREPDKSSTFLLLRAWAADRQAEGKSLTCLTKPIAITRGSGSLGPCHLGGGDWDFLKQDWHSWLNWTISIPVWNRLCFRTL